MLASWHGNVLGAIALVAGLSHAAIGATGTDHTAPSQYVRTYLEVRGGRVEFADSIHGLYGLAGEIDVLEAPAPGAPVIGHYSADTEVEIVDAVTGADRYYVSPCNACASEFVPKAAVHPLRQ